MSEPAKPDFDFEEWARLAREDPEAFERRRLEEIRRVIEARPDLRPRLEGLQFRIDAERRLARTPLKACLKMSSMMWDSFLALKDRLDELASGPPAADAAVPPSAPPASVIPLRRPPTPER